MEAFMKKSILILGILLSSNSQAQTIDVSQLNEIDRQIHRVAYCRQLVSWNIDRLNFKFDHDLIMDMTELLRESGLFGYKNTVFKKTQNDTRAKLILGEIKLSQRDFSECTGDLKKILKKEYVPNFSYMEK